MTTDKHTILARVNGYSWAREYRLDWATKLAFLDAEVPQESRSLSRPTVNARDNGDGSLTIVGDLPGELPERGASFTIVRLGERHALASGKLKGA